MGRQTASTAVAHSVKMNLGLKKGKSLVKVGLSKAKALFFS